MEPSSLSHPPTDRQPLVRRFFTSEKESPLDQVTWTRRTARAGTFVQEDVEAPDFWSDNAVGVVAKLYFATVDGVRESSVRQMIERVARKITREGFVHGYFTRDAFELDGDRLEHEPSDADAFYDELCHLLVNQMATFNTPVWLNVGVPGRPQCCSACFLLRVEDTMFGKGDMQDPHSIVSWWANEAKIFKTGAGSGINVSNLRGSMEKLSTGGIASGPGAYVRASDTAAGTLKSGGAHRRAAKMVCYDVDHPDIFDLVDTKPREDRRMRILKDGGEEIDPSTPSGEKVIAECTSFQNENQSACAPDSFMEIATSFEHRGLLNWPLKARTTEDITAWVGAAELLRKIAEGAWQCGDPGMIFIDQVNRWHTTPSLGPITTCNPCGEVWTNDDSSCNLASLNLRRFQDSQGELVVDYFRAAVDVMILAMDITCSFSDLPIPEIERNTRDLRQLGLGYANLGAALMTRLEPYDSDAGRDWAASVTALMTGRAYRRSAEIAREMGAYARFAENRDTHLGVIQRHLGAIPDDKRDDGGVWDVADLDWREAYVGGIEYGYRNSQVTVIAPTGTTSFKMDCDTTGCEPPFALSGTKNLAGGGSMTLANESALVALDRLGYSTSWAREMLSRGVLVDGIAEKHRPVFACANDISPEGHVRMVAAIQPFLSGAPSKTVNLPESATVEEIEALYVLAWRLGCKAISVFRHNSKVTSILDHGPKTEWSGKEKTEVLPGTVLATSAPQKDEGPATESTEPSLHEREERVQAHFTTSPPVVNERRKLSRDVPSLRHRMNVGDHKAYIHVGKYDDGAPGELFVSSAGSEGSFVQGMWGAFAKVTSLALQYGVPLEAIVHQLANDEFEPKGPTGNPTIPYAKSMVSYVARWLASEFLSVEEHEAMGILTPEVKAKLTAELDERQSHDVVIDARTREEFTVTAVQTFGSNGNGHAYRPGTKPCTCGGMMVQTGACWTCTACATSTGCG